MLSNGTRLRPLSTGYIAGSSFLGQVKVIVHESRRGLDWDASQLIVDLIWDKNVSHVKWGLGVPVSHKDLSVLYIGVSLRNEATLTARCSSVRARLRITGLCYDPHKLDSVYQTPQFGARKSILEWEDMSRSAWKKCSRFPQLSASKFSSLRIILQCSPAR